MNYLLFATLSYSYGILRPLQDEIRRRGHRAVWYLEPSCEDRLLPDEERVYTVDEVKNLNPVAVFAPGNYIPHFFPGVKVCLFHGYPIAKRPNARKDDHFNIRGWFDIYCTQGPAATIPFLELERKHGFFKVYETGWAKNDYFFDRPLDNTLHTPPTVLYSTTFIKGITSVYTVLPVIRALAAKRNWNWVIIFHPKLTDPQLIADYQQLDSDFDNVTFKRYGEGAKTYRQTDVMLCDSSSIIIEYMLMQKPVVTYRNTNPGPWLLDVQNTEDIESAIDKALTYPSDLMAQVKKYVDNNDPYCDGHNCARIMDAVDDFIANHQDRMKSKPLNIIRKYKMRKQFKYWRLK